MYRIPINLFRCRFINVIYIIEKDEASMMDKIKNLKKYFNLKRNSTITFLTSIFLTLMCEMIFKKSIMKTMFWIINNPISFVLNWLIILALILFLAAILNTRLSVIISSIIIILISLINYVKFSLRGVVLLPQDFNLIKELVSIIKLVLDIKFIMFSIATLALIIMIILLTRSIPKAKIGSIEKMTYLSISIILLLSLRNIGYIDKSLLNQQNISAENNGFLFFFFSNIQTKSNNYLEAKVDADHELMNNLLNKENDYILKKEKPNIIIIMNEAFWDPNIMQGVKFNKKLTENIDKLKLDSIHGYMESPEFGGGTSNAEFELLTGHSMHFYKPGVMVYPNEIKQPLMALPSILKAQGYTTKAIHSYKGWYWNRKEVYKYLGFDEFISEEYLVNPKQKGFYVSDEYVTDLIINELENTNDPSLIFAVTMQNHGPYNDRRYKDSQQEIEISNELDSESLQILKTYSQGIYDADKALGKLIKYCSNLEKSTVVLFFGDHLPMLGPDLKVYKEFDYIQGDIDNNEKFKLYSTPFILWSNYDKNNKNIGALNMSFMAPYLLRYAGLDMPEYYKLLYKFSKEIPVISRSYAIDKDNNFIECEDEKYDRYNKIYKELQYDLMYHKKNLIQDSSKWVVKNNENYNARLDNISINNIEKTESKVIVNGQNFYPNCNLYVDNRQKDFIYVSRNTIYISNKDMKNNTQIQMKLLDSNKDLISESNVYKFSAVK